MWMAAYGPKALRLVGEQADGFILQTADPDIARWTFGAVRAAADAAGRDPSSITMCVAAPAYVGDDLAHQREQLRWFGGMVGNHVADLVARYGDRRRRCPRALTDYIAGRQAYDYSHHGKAGNPSIDFVPDEIVDRFCLLGPASAHIERLRELADDRRRPVRPLPDARRRGSHPRRLRRRDHPRAVLNLGAAFARSARFLLLSPAVKGAMPRAGWRSASCCYPFGGAEPKIVDRCIHPRVHNDP